MTKQRRLYLDDFQPQSELTVKNRSVTHPKFPVIDVHTHFGPLVLGPGYRGSYNLDEVVRSLRVSGVEHVFNVEVLWDEQLQLMLDHLQPYSDFITSFGSVDVARLDEREFPDLVRTTLMGSVKRGIRGLKFWKDISLGMKDRNGKYIAIDDERLRPIWDTAAELHLPVLIHIADPVAFFRPTDRYNERYEELARKPEWSFCKPQLYTFDQLMAQQERLLETNPDTTFIIAHVGSCAENLNYVAECLRRYPNMYIDISGRLGELGRQPYTARNFFVSYKDRIMFGTDFVPGSNAYSKYYEFLETRNEYFDYSDAPIPPQGRWMIYGIGLDDDVLELIYRGNARRVLGIG